VLPRREFETLEVGIAIGTGDRRHKRVAVIHLKLDGIRTSLERLVRKPQGGLEIPLVVTADLGD
jgi:hypothetical protein